ncbi:MAG: hypothetical protein Phog2KO_32460 [Phototrophicaceae bacterium]
MRFFRVICISIILTSSLSFAFAQEKAELIILLSEQLDTDDFALIEANIDALTTEQLQHIYDFMTDAHIIADSQWFDVSHYDNWEDYNFYRSTDEQLITILGRRDLFIDPARQLNNRSITNMSDDALATLTFSQVYVEETWDQVPPWDGDSNTQFNWVHPDLLETPSLSRYITEGFLYQERVGYWYATHWSTMLALANYFYIGSGSDEQLILNQLDYQAPRLAGYAYPIGNQLYLGTAETVYWFTDYLQISEERYGGLITQEWDTDIVFEYPTESILSDEYAITSQNEILWQVLSAPFARNLRLELSHPETASFWNVMRYLHASARQREGGASAENPENGQPSLFALRYGERTDYPVGRSPSDISAFAILTTVYSDSILLDFTNWDMNQNTLLTTPSDENRSDGLNRLVSERNKAILVVEHMNNETIYPNATHIVGSRGLGLQLVTQYDDPVTGDFLPYTPEEAYMLTMALYTESAIFELEASQTVLCNSPLLREGYEIYSNINPSTNNWIFLTGNLCET